MQWREDFLDPADKKERIIDMAAMYILDDIRTTFYDLSEYPSFSNSYEIEDVIPPSLLRFLRGIIKTKFDIQQVSYRRICSIAYVLISAARLLSFISSLLLAIITYINQNFASKELINILSSLSFSESYKELKRLHDAILSSGKPSFDLSGFVKFVFDNTDFNISTLTGHGTFHSLGGLVCTTPSRPSDKGPLRRSVNLSTDQNKTFANVMIKRNNKRA